MKKMLILLFAGLALVSVAVTLRRPGPVVLDRPAGTECETWMEGNDVFLSVTNVTPVAVSGTVTLNEIFEKVLNVSNRFRAEIDGRWIEIELPPKGGMLLRLGK